LESYYISKKFKKDIYKNIKILVNQQLWKSNISIFETKPLKTNGLQMYFLKFFFFAVIIALELGA